MATPERKDSISLLQRLLSTMRVQRNQTRLRRASRKCDKLVLTVVKPTGCSGNPDRFYHFIFDLLLPLHTVVANAPPSVQFAVGGLGPFEQELLDLFPHRFEIYKSRTAKAAIGKGYAPRQLRGMNPRGVRVSRAQMSSFKQFMLDAKGITPGAKPQMLLVERKPPVTYYVERGKSTSGTGRRSIVNHRQLRDVVASLDRAQGGFSNVQLEDTTLAEQMQLFCDADLVIAQHGAALSNALWMKPGSDVVEISKHKSYNHFAVLCEILGINHHPYLVEGDHVEIDTDDFKRWLCARGLDQR